VELNGLHAQAGAHHVEMYPLVSKDHRRSDLLSVAKQVDLLSVLKQVDLLSVLKQVETATDHEIDLLKIPQAALLQTQVFWLPRESFQHPMDALV